MKSCCACGSATKELMPYGPEGAPICFECAMRPERKAETEANYEALLSSAGRVAVLTAEGPVSYQRRPKQ